MSERLTLSEWQDRVSGLPPLLSLLSHDLYTEQRAPANAVAEAYRTLHQVAKRCRTQNGNRVPFRTQHACRDACVEWDALEFIYGASGVFPLDGALATKLDEAADSMRKATQHEPVGKKALWKHKGWQLPAYIQHIANDLREKRGMTESRAIATAIAAVKRWAAGGGNVDAGTKAAAAKAVAEWEALKARSKASRGAKAAGRAARESAFVAAVGALKHTVQPMPDQASFAVRYANRLSNYESAVTGLRHGNQAAIQMTAQLLEAPADTEVTDLVERLLERKHMSMVLMEALGYSSKPIRAKTADKHRGRYHGMHGVQKAVRTRSHIPSDDEHPVLAAKASGDRLREAEMIAEAAPSLAAAPASPIASAAFEQLHPRATHGQFGTKPGQAAAPAQQAGAPGGGDPAAAQALVREIQMADPQFRKQYAETAQFARSHPTGATKAAAAAVALASDQLQSIGYANDHAGIVQFQKDEDLPVTGRIDEATLRTVQTVYSQNARYSRSRAPDFTGIPGSGATVKGRGTPRAAPGGRRTLGATSQKKVREATVNILFPGTGPTHIIPPGLHHANTGPEGGRANQQPGGDDFSFQNPPENPPNLREHDGVNACATCVHFSPKGWVTEAHINGGCMAYTFPVHRLDTCDDWLTLTPPDAPLRIFEARLREAEETGRGSEIMAARAALKTVRERYTDVEPLDFHVASEWLFEALYALKLEEREISAGKRRELAKKGQTLKRGTSYPIESLGDLSNAIQAYGRANDSDRPALKRLLQKMARKLNASDEVKQRIAALGAGA